MISSKEVQHIAKLARLNITKEEEKKFTKELSLILDYTEKLKEVDVKSVEPTSHPFEIENVMRRDRAEEKERIGERLVKMAPSSDKGYVEVKKVLSSKKK